MDAGCPKGTCFHWIWKRILWKSIAALTSEQNGMASDTSQSILFRMEQLARCILRTPAHRTDSVKKR